MALQKKNTFKKKKNNTTEPKMNLTENIGNGN